MNVIIFGPPGAGKGTQAQNIVKKFNLHQVSTGDLLRTEIKNKSEIGKEIEEIISKGVSDYQRLKSNELVYLGVLRTPIQSVEKKKIGNISDDNF